LGNVLEADGLGDIESIFVPQMRDLRWTGGSSGSNVLGGAGGKGTVGWGSGPQRE